ncbi:MAG TPA: hypothetical protein VJ989_04610 [Solirubrobacterales bacterium]|nr:hypothetical protein [Solirubrobacterales bacterium]
MSDSGAWPGHDLRVVESAMLEMAVELHPTHLSAEGLLQRIVSKRADALEIETARQAIANLRESGVFHEHDDGLLEPTRPTLRTAGLLTGALGC